MGEKTNRKAPNETSRRETRNLQVAGPPAKRFEGRLFGRLSLFFPKGINTPLSCAQRNHLAAIVAADTLKTAACKGNPRQSSSAHRAAGTPHRPPHISARRKGDPWRTHWAATLSRLPSYRDVVPQITRQPSRNATCVPREHGARRTQYGRTSSRGYAISCKFVSRPPPRDREHTRNS